MVDEVHSVKTGMILDLIKDIESKWQKVWEEKRVYEADPDPKKPKYFITFPYPYVNALPHLGSAFTVLRVDIMARYKRMQGYNVLFAQGWHATGGPIVAAALRLREGDKKIINTLKIMGIDDSEIEKFYDPAYWVYYFTKQWKKDFKRYGLSIDWRREFFTTSLNPYYSKFVEWQYLTLKKKGLIAKGKHPVVWCPREKKVVGDHDRPDEYAGISPSEAIIIKFRTDDDLVLPALTYRPETIFGVTNIWVHPDAEYIIAKIDGEKWVISEYEANELADQGYRVEREGKIKGRDLIGKMAKVPIEERWVPVLPARFVDPELGTGIVMSVPAHAPFDYIGLEDLKKHPEMLEEFGIDPSIVRGLKPIPLIRTPGYSEIPARDAVERRGITSQEEKEKLEDATKEIYSKEYHTGVLLEITGKWKGKIVSEAKDEIVEWIVSNNYGIRIFTLPQRVYCRCGARTHVKIVEDQWFLLYSKKEWKQAAHQAIDAMEFYPHTLRKEFHRLVDWYNDWACAHKHELGTPLPWDKEWVVESLSDSTIYMAYYTIAKYLQHPEIYGIRPEQLIPEVFDYIFLGEGDPREISEKTGIDRDLLQKMRDEFLYWYPVDLRISGKDLIQNHLVFYIFHHTAIFPPHHWPKAIGVNGWVLLRGAKMSKSTGNFILLRQALQLWGADPTRWAEVMGGADPGLDDANFEPEMAVQGAAELFEWLNFAEKNYYPPKDRVRENRLSIDDWFESTLNSIILETTKYMEETRFKSALVSGYYKLQATYKWYIKRAGKPRKDLLKKFIEVQTLMLAPFVPHIAEEIWHRIGKSTLIVTESWPNVDKSKINPNIERAENIIKKIIEDAKEIMKFIQNPRKMTVVIPSDWKYEFIEKVVENRKKGLTLKDSIREASKTIKDRVSKKDLGKIIKLITKYPEVVSLYIPKQLETRYIKESAEFLAKELGLEQVVVVVEEEIDHPKKTQSLPSKPALILE